MDIIAQLKKEILSLTGFRAPSGGIKMELGLGAVAKAFPNGSFPTGAVHEFITMDRQEGAASGGFLAGLLGTLMQGGSACVWISASRTLFPPALAAFGIQPEKIIFIDLPKEQDVLWAMEEALKCEGLAAVVGEIREISFVASRRLQLAVEKSRVTGFVLRHQPRQLNTVACIARWKITSLPSVLEEGMPGVGFPRWKVELQKIRNGIPGQWIVEWAGGLFHVIPAPTTLSISPIQSSTSEPRRKTG